MTISPWSTFWSGPAFAFARAFEAGTIWEKKTNSTVTKIYVFVCIVVFFKAAGYPVLTHLGLIWDHLIYQLILLFVDVELQVGERFVSSHNNSVLEAMNRRNGD